MNVDADPVGKDAASVSLDAPTRAALVAYVLAWADDELVLGHRDAEWTGFAPQIEEDVAFSSIAQDELGHATLLYGIAAEVQGDDPDRLALRRPAEEYRHVALLERPNGDWAHTIARHVLYDTADARRTGMLSGSSYAPLAGAACKMVREEHYHRMHDEAWLERLRDGTPESRARLIDALRVTLPLAVDVFGETPDEGRLLDAGIMPRRSRELLEEWRAELRTLLADLGADLAPLLDREPASRDARARPVGDDFRALHAEMTMVSASGIGERW